MKKAQSRWNYKGPFFILFKSPNFINYTGTYKRNLVRSAITFGGLLLGINKIKMNYFEVVKSVAINKLIVDVPKERVSLSKESFTSCNFQTVTLMRNGVHELHAVWEVILYLSEGNPIATSHVTTLFSLAMKWDEISIETKMAMAISALQSAVALFLIECRDNVNGIGQFTVPTEGFDEGIKAKLANTPSPKKDIAKMMAP